MIFVHEIHELLLRFVQRYGGLAFAVCVLILVGCVSGGAYFVFIKPMRDDNAIYRTSINKINKYKNDLQPLLAGQKTLEQQLVSLGAQQPSSLSSDDYHKSITTMIERAVDQGLIIESYERQQHDAQEHIVVKLKGAFDNLLSFLRALKKAQLRVYGVLLAYVKEKVFARLTFVANAL